MKPYQFSSHKMYAVVFAIAVLLTLISHNTMSQTYKKRTYANFQGVYRTGLFTLGSESVFGSVTNASLAADQDSKTASTLQIPLGLLGTATVTQFLEFTTTGSHSTVRTLAAGTPVAIKFLVPKSLLGLIDGIEIGSYTGLNSVSQSISGPAAILGTGSGNADGYNSTAKSALYSGSTLLNALNGAGELELTVTPSVAFNGVYVKLTGNLLSVALTTSVFHAYILEDASLQCSTMNSVIDVLSGVQGNPLVNALSATGDVTSPWNAVDNDPSLTTYTTLSTGAQVLSNVFETVIFETASQPGDSVSIVLQDPGAGLLDLALLKGFTIQPYLGTTPVGSPIDASSALIVLRLLSGGSNKYELSAAIPVSFDRIEIKMGGVVDALSNLRIYDVSRSIAGPSISVGSQIVTNDTVLVDLGNSVELSATSSASDNIDWYDQNGQLLGSGSSYTIASAMSDGLYVAKSSRNGCSGLSATHNVYVKVANALTLALQERPRIRRENDLTGDIRIQNPVYDKLVIQFSGMPKGRYTISLNGIDGKLLYNKVVVLGSDRQIETITVAGHISAGLFVVRLSNGVSVNRAFKIIAK